MQEVVHGREIDESKLRVSVMVGSVEKKGAANLLSELSSEFPLQRFNIGHLKRARPRRDSTSLLEVVVSTSESYECVIPASIKARLVDVKAVETYSVEPSTKKEWELWSESWPLHYRPSDLARTREKGFSVQETTRAELFLARAEADGAAFSAHELQVGLEMSGMRGGVVVNPANDKIVTTSHTAYQHMCSEQGGAKDAAVIAAHPLYSAAMLCIHGVAEAVLGRLATTDPCALPHQAYLCTGLEFYLVQEPDLTSSMALVHSRIKSLTFRHKDEDHGALASHYRLGDMRALNHRFRVYSIPPSASASASPSPSASST